MEDLYALPATILAPEAPPLPVPAEHVAIDTRGPDPLDCGFSVSNGLLAPLPAKIRLPHEDDDADR